MFHIVHQPCEGPDYQPRPLKLTMPATSSRTSFLCYDRNANAPQLQRLDHSTSWLVSSPVANGD